ncbi:MULTISPECIES: DUF2480 family protein [unclassified Apibacter]|uniref:DUF2480 family protein n=1 Tax=unclassified Apibacter TaxID=2630820 RepID=UPI0013223FBF|nr:MULTISPECIES: DUF2480 family protein [unclassified Apibacter]MCX8676802.1 DUF2480 family protein [Apibacter sp. B3919]MXO24816.1 DUF2480 family protein [Apibacter sp. B3924]MXO26060.1 DUF2480 family protein [Apibacter sp. B3813]MXO28011.1 DUF2480 family protein [Apibacter sp. B3913]MXO29629.1 DUF2480 family protein [Apibacter sp. B3912]
MDEIINKVEKSGLITLDLEDFYPKEPRMLFDLKDYLYEGLVLREKEFRENLSKLDWKMYENAYVSVICTSDAIVPSWSYLLIANYLTGVAKLISFGTLEDLERDIFTEIIDKMDVDSYKDKKIIIKGCSRKPVPQNAYLQLIQKLKPIASSLMFGEACSTVPIFKKKKL